MNATNIGWTDFSANPVKYRNKVNGKIVWACVKASPGCVHCYAETLALRWGKGAEFTAPNIDAVEPFLDTDELQKLLKSPKLTGKRVFIEDMSDLFGPWVPDEMIDRVFALFALRPDVTFQVLTKRADRMAEYLTGPVCLETREEAVAAFAMHIGKIVWDARGSDSANYGCIPRTSAAEVASRRVWPGWPLPNVLVGFSAENQQWFDKRWPHAERLAKAGWRTWASFEPLLGPIGVAQAMPADGRGAMSWAVVGGESGHGRRACEVEAIINLAEQFREAGVPLFVKQDSGQYPGKQGRIPLDIWELKQHPTATVALPTKPG